MSNPASTTISVLVPKGHPHNETWRDLRRRNKLVLLPLSPLKIEHLDGMTGEWQSLYYTTGIPVDDVRERLLGEYDQATTKLVLRHPPTSGIFELPQSSGLTFDEAIKGFAEQMGIRDNDRRISLRTMKKDEVWRVVRQIEERQRQELREALWSFGYGGLGDASYAVYPGYGLGGLGA